MRIEVTKSVARSASFWRVAFLSEGSDPGAGVPARLADSIRVAAKSAGFRGRDRETAGAAGRDGSWLLVGLGRAPAPLARLRRALRRAVGESASRSKSRLLLVFGAGVDQATMTALLPHLALADYAFERYKSPRKKLRRNGETTAVVVPPADVAAGPLGMAAREAQVVAETVSWARDLGNTPANDLGPAELARAAVVAGRGDGFAVRVLGPAAIRREKLAGLIAVNAGSVRPPAFVIAEYRPRSPRGTAVLVGKGITFDSGGISIKPAPSMGEMKYDMMGAATALACVRAARALRLPVRVVALTPLTENLPSGSATRPGDILRMRNGKTVEVDNTDAEGRLVLADALSYAQRFRPDVLLDYATLTGAVLIALGHECAAVFSSDDRLAQELLAAGEATGERLWRLPLWDDYRENLRSEWADMKNTAGRAAGTVNAALFLKEFVPAGVPWAHLDIAGVAHFEKEHAGFAAGATGFGVAMTMEFLKQRFGKPRPRAERKNPARPRRAK
ncbi:MAG TPA: leucyl aminopeptidase [Thermoanaerobaculia bacterium]|nr:leucyl aminopeptidase [Thermoanaerobaculia bacterium]